MKPLIVKDKNIYADKQKAKEVSDGYLNSLKHYKGRIEFIMRYWKDGEIWNWSRTIKPPKQKPNFAPNID